MANKGLDAAGQGQGQAREPEQTDTAGVDGPREEVKLAIDLDLEARHNAYLADETQRAEELAAFTSLTLKYGKTLLGLSVAYVHASMGQNTDVSPEDILNIEAHQDQINLMAAATLASTGRYIS